ncbi:adenosylcobinamide-GDP ribazoletransferase [Sphingomonas echinoides]|uniref:Adenosylcobinamide-GDP ribazoletransferase n=1 Tax=Sphingomonas echinoides TaxID=59803 RepID=A0ABU4PL93_9SPHN|nr:adenosylcobinamide-GDP ribazoletransferase [Sphingomonas echinoides]MDX5982695.1 adenosylcobinamide-GDP ribazoletransferase [Sphingomonas echinoides]
MKSVLLAIQFLTRLPTPQVQATERDFARSMRWFPAVGLIIGALVAGGAWLGAQLDGWVAALAAVAVWVGVTGALHLDGLADLADGYGAAHKDRARLLAVMADPHVGSFGVVAIVLQLLAKLVLVHALIAAGDVFPALILLPFAARIGPLVWTLWLPPLHAGLGARFVEHVRVSHIVGWSVALAAGAIVVPAILLAVPLIALWGVWLRRTLGGVSGDCHGAGIELVETGLLLAVLALRHL